MIKRNGDTRRMGFIPGTHRKQTEANVDSSNPNTSLRIMPINSTAASMEKKTLNKDERRNWDRRRIFGSNLGSIPSVNEDLSLPPVISNFLSNKEKTKDLNGNLNLNNFRPKITSPDRPHIFADIPFYTTDKSGLTFPVPISVNNLSLTIYNDVNKPKKFRNIDPQTKPPHNISSQLTAKQKIGSQTIESQSNTKSTIDTPLSTKQKNETQSNKKLIESQQPSTKQIIEFQSVQQKIQPQTQTNTYEKIQPQSQPNTNEKIQPQPNINEKIQPQPNTNEKIQPQPNTNEKIQPQPNTNEKIQPQPNTNEKIQPQLNTNEKIHPQQNENRSNARQKIESQQNTKEKIEFQRNAKEISENRSNANETINSQPGIMKQKIDSHLNTEPKIASNYNEQQQIESSLNGSPKFESHLNEKQKMEFSLNLNEIQSTNIEVNLSEIEIPNVDCNLSEITNFDFDLKETPTFESQLNFRQKTKPKQKMKQKIESRLNAKQKVHSQSDMKQNVEHHLNREQKIEFRSKLNLDSQTDLKQKMTHYLNTKQKLESQKKFFPNKLDSKLKIPLQRSKPKSTHSHVSTVFKASSSTAKPKKVANVTQYTNGGSQAENITVRKKMSSLKNRMLKQREENETLAMEMESKSVIKDAKPVIKVSSMKKSSSHKNLEVGKVSSTVSKLLKPTNANHNLGSHKEVDIDDKDISGSDKSKKLSVQNKKSIKEKVMKISSTTTNASVSVTKPRSLSTQVSQIGKGASHNTKAKEKQSQDPNSVTSPIESVLLLSSSIKKNKEKASRKGKLKKLTVDIESVSDIAISSSNPPREITTPEVEKFLNSGPFKLDHKSSKTSFRERPLTPVSPKGIRDVMLHSSRSHWKEFDKAELALHEFWSLLGLKGSEKVSSPKVMQEKCSGYLKCKEFYPSRDKETKILSIIEHLNKSDLIALKEDGRPIDSYTDLLTTDSEVQVAKISSPKANRPKCVDKKKSLKKSESIHCKVGSDVEYSADTDANFEINETISMSESELLPLECNYNSPTKEIPESDYESEEGYTDFEICYTGSDENPLTRSKYATESENESILTLEKYYQESDNKSISAHVENPFTDSENGSMLTLDKYYRETDNKSILAAEQPFTESENENILISEKCLQQNESEKSSLDIFASQGDCKTNIDDGIQDRHVCYSELNLPQVPDTKIGSEDEEEFRYEYHYEPPHVNRNSRESSPHPISTGIHSREKSYSKQLVLPPFDIDSDDSLEELANAYIDPFFRELCTMRFKLGSNGSSQDKTTSEEDIVLEPEIYFSTQEDSDYNDNDYDPSSIKNVKMLNLSFFDHCTTSLQVASMEYDDQETERIFDRSYLDLAEEKSEFCTDFEAMYGEDSATIKTALFSNENQLSETTDYYASIEDEQFSSKTSMDVLMSSDSCKDILVVDSGSLKHADDECKYEDSTVALAKNENPVVWKSSRKAKEKITKFSPCENCKHLISSMERSRAGGPRKSLSMTVLVDEEEDFTSLEVSPLNSDDDLAQEMSVNISKKVATKKKCYITVQAPKEKNALQTENSNPLTEEQKDVTNKPPCLRRFCKWCSRVLTFQK